ncbi:hypothetical protein SynA1840_01011 [Synechococcus sp. A18-40]|nr:hypothetical protein SynA1840_01011 [Synechococcus sp. A18-40]
MLSFQMLCRGELFGDSVVVFNVELNRTHGSALIAIRR